MNLAAPTDSPVVAADVRGRTTHLLPRETPLPHVGGYSDLLESVIETLQQGEALLTEISNETYTRKVSIAFNASIGGHYRHCLDHFRSLLDSATEGDLNYDHRERNTLIEKDRYAALNATRELIEGYERLDSVFLMRP